MMHQLRTDKGPRNLIYVPVRMVGSCARGSVLLLVEAQCQSVFLSNREMVTARVMFAVLVNLVQDYTGTRELETASSAPRGTMGGILFRSLVSRHPI
jgi:hypothetical protein